MATRKKKLQKVEDAQIVTDPLQEFYVKRAGVRSTYQKVYGVSKQDVGMDYAGYEMEGDKPVLKVCKDVYTLEEMVEKGLLKES